VEFYSQRNHSLTVSTHLTKTLYIFTILVLISIFSIAQTNWKSELKLIEYDSLLHNRIYEIKVEDNQFVQLIELQNGEFEGSLTNSVWETNPKEERDKRIVQKINIPKSTVDLLMHELKQNDFENIPDCNNCMGLEGTTTYFFIKSDKVERTYSYWELESDYYHKEPNISVGLRKSRKILDLINKQFDLKQEFKKFISRLPIKKHSYNSIFMGAETGKGTKVFKVSEYIEESRIKRVKRQLLKHGFINVRILSLEQVDHILTMEEKNDDSRKVVSNSLRGVMTENAFRNLKIAETLYFQVKFVEKAYPNNLRIVKLNLSFKFKKIIK